MNRMHIAILATTVLTCLALVVSGCSGSGYGDAAEPDDSTPTPVTRAAEPTAIATVTDAGEPTSIATPAPTDAPAQSTELTLVASSLQFDQGALTAPAGAVTIEFENQDEGIPHNLHVFAGSDDSGDEIGSTEIEEGPVRQTLDLGELDSGSYFYQCDVHPSQMMGTLTVS